VFFSFPYLISPAVLAVPAQCEKAIDESNVPGIENYCASLKVSNNIAEKKLYYFLLGLAQFDNSAGDPANPLFARALENVSTAIAIDPKSPSAYQLRGMIYLNNKSPDQAISKDADKAVKDFSVAISLESAKKTNALNYYYRGLAYNQLLNIDAAWADFQQARALDPSNQDIQSAWQKQRQFSPQGRAETRRLLDDIAKPTPKK
jgi:tetratricopeptide (TPR) repeat protein